MNGLTYWAAYWSGSPKESAIWVVDIMGQVEQRLCVFGITEQLHSVATSIVEYHNERNVNAYVV